MKIMKYKKSLLVMFILACTIFTIPSCYYDKELIMENTPVITDNISFSKDIIPIFSQSCNGSGCHNGSIAPNLSPSTAYNALMNGNYINTGSPETSELYLWMTGKKSTPMPLSGPNATYNAKILAWIKQGAQNN